MATNISPEQRSALAEAGWPLLLKDDELQRSFVLIPQEEYRRLLGEDLQREIQLGVDQIDRGECEEWDVEAVFAEAQRRFGR